MVIRNDIGTKEMISINTTLDNRSTLKKSNNSINEIK